MPTPPEPGGLIHVADIINSVKCGLAQALVADAGRRRLPGAVATVELQLKIVDDRSVGASSPGATTVATTTSGAAIATTTLGPFVLPWAGPISLPNISGTYAQSFTVDTTINLTYRLDAPNVQVCRAAGVEVSDRFGFARWLADVIAGLSSVTLAGPKGSLDKLVYDATFAVTRGGSGGASLNVVFLNAGANASRTRADTQHLKIVISGGPQGIATTADGETVVRPIQTRDIGPIPNLSSSPPARR